MTWRFVPGLPSMRRRDLAGAVGRTVRAITQSNAARATGFRIIHVSIQADHLHLIVEAGGKKTLMKGLRGLGTWIGRRVNEALGRHGRVLSDRYHARALSTPREVRNAILYVLQNHKHHEPSRFLVDENSSGMWFTGWAQPIPRPPTPPPTAEPRTWLARTGWRRHGLIRFEEAPAS